MVELSKGIETAINGLLDREAIRDLVAKYCHLVWQRDLEGLSDLFTDDAVVNDTLNGKKGLMAMYVRQLRDRDQHPYAHNHVFEIHGSDYATGTCYGDFYGIQNGKSMIMSGYWKDEYVKVNGEWKFRSRHFTKYFYTPLLEGWAEQENS